MVSEHTLLGAVEDRPTTFSPLGIHIPPLYEGSPISAEHHFQQATELTNKYQLDDQLPLEGNVNQIGQNIARDFPFQNQRLGCNSLAGQLDNMDLENRDCKLPTFLLALSLSLLYPDADVKILLDRLSPFHPFVSFKIGDQQIIGDYLLGTDKGTIVFHAPKDSTQMSIPRTDRQVFVLPNLEGMKIIDEAFINEKFN